MANELNLAGRRLLELIALSERADAAVAACQPLADAARAVQDRDELVALDAELSAALTAALTYGSLLYQQKRGLEAVVQDAAGPSADERLDALAAGEALPELRRAQVALDQAFAHLRFAEAAADPRLTAVLGDLRQGLGGVRDLLEQTAGASHLYLDALDEVLRRERRPQLVALDTPAPQSALDTRPGLSLDSSLDGPA